MPKHALLVLLICSTAFASGQPDLETITAYRPAAIDDACAPEATIFLLWFQKSFPGRWVTTVGFVAETKPATFGHVLALFQIGDIYYSWDLNFGAQRLGKLAGLPDLAVLTDVAKRRYEVAYTLTIERMRSGIEPVTIGKVPVQQGGEVISIYETEAFLSAVGACVGKAYPTIAFFQVAIPLGRFVFSRGRIPNEIRQGFQRLKVVFDDVVIATGGVHQVRPTRGHPYYATKCR